MHFKVLEQDDFLRTNDQFWTGITWQECGRNLQGIRYDNVKGLVVIRHAREDKKTEKVPDYFANSPGYRGLVKGDILREGDEFCPIGSIEWRKITQTSIGECLTGGDEGFFRRKVETPELIVFSTTLPPVPKVVKECFTGAKMPEHVAHKDPLMNPPPFKIICVNEEHRKLVLNFLYARGYRFHIYGKSMNVDKYCETFKFDEFPHIGHNMASCGVGEIAVIGTGINDFKKIPTIHLHEVQTYIAPEPVVKVGDVYKNSKGVLLLVGHSTIVSLDNGEICYTHETIKSLKSMIRMDNATLVKRGVKVNI